MISVVLPVLRDGRNFADCVSVSKVPEAQPRQVYPMQRLCSDSRRPRGHDLYFKQTECVAGRIVALRCPALERKSQHPCIELARAIPNVSL